MIPTPQQVIPLVECVVPSLIDALEGGIAFADTLQPEALARDPAYWSHSARFHARQRLLAADREGWTIARRAANSGIHLSFEGCHQARVLKTLYGTTPHAGTNHARQVAWSYAPFLPIGTTIVDPFTLIFDWNRDESGLVLSAGLPRWGGSYPNGAVLHWRVPVTGNADEDLAGLEYDDNDPEGSATVIRIDPEEKYRGEEL